MKKAIATVLVAVVMILAPAGVHAGTSDYDLAKAWMQAHAKGGHIETLNTTAKGGYKGKVSGKGRGIVRYPKKVKKGRRVKVYLVFKKGENECSAMICLGKVKQ